jgi:hypothetical protein
MSLPTFKFTKFGAPTNNESVNSGLSVSSKMQKSGIISTIKEKAQDTFKDMNMPEISLDSGGQDSSDDGESFFSIWTLVKLVIVVVIVWFMWSSLSSNPEFYLGMGEFGDKINSVFKSMEEKGREFISRYTNIEVSPSSSDYVQADGDGDGDSDSDSSDDESNVKKPRHYSKGAHRPPVPPDATNSSDKKPGFLTDDSKYTFLDKADRAYSGPSPRADDTTSVTQKHQSGKGGYCYIGEDRGFRSCVKVDASDKCMSGEVYSRQDICIDPTLRE